MSDTENPDDSHVDLNNTQSPCPIERGMRVIGGKWKGSILWHLRNGPLRFNELTRRVGGASNKMVAQRLTEMEQTGLVIREVISTKPFAVTYKTSELGDSALTVLKKLHKWSTTYKI